MPPTRNIVIMMSVALALLAAFAFHGRIDQPAHYHHFADQWSWMHMAHVRDVLSNLPFLVIGLWGVTRYRTHPSQHHTNNLAYLCLSLSIVLTCFGSMYYHLEPNNDRLFWDRLPIALVCCYLLLSLSTEWIDRCKPLSRLLSINVIIVCAVVATLSVMWWKFSGDLRWYLLLQIYALVLPLVGIAIYPTSQDKKKAIIGAVCCYVLAKICEVKDVAIADTLIVITGHNIKHLLSALAAYLITK